MFGKGLALMGVGIALLSGCARPNYEMTKESDQKGGVGQGSPLQRASDCSLRFKTSRYCLSWAWEDKPTGVKAGSLVFKVYRGNVYDDSPVETDFASRPTVVLWMPSMGHGSSPTEVHRLDVGTYRATNVFFIMPGEWEIRFRAKDGGGVDDEAVAALVF